MREIRPLSELSYRFEPHDHIYPPGQLDTMMYGYGDGWEEVYPGYGDRWVAGRAIPVPHQAIPGPSYSVILKIRPYPRPNEG